MSRIFKRPNSPYYWYQSGTEPHRTRLSLKTKNKKEAESLQRQLDRQKTFNKFGIPNTLPIYLTVALEIYNDKVLVAKSHSWSRKIRSQLNSFREYLNNDPHIDTISPGHIEDYKNNLLITQAPKTARDKVITLGKFFDYYRLQGNIINNPCDGIDLPTKRPVNPRKPVPIEKIKEAIDNAPRKVDYLFWSVLLYTQLRVIDAGSLTKEDLITGKLQRKNKNPIPIYIPDHLKDEDLTMLAHTDSKKDYSLKLNQEIMMQLGFKTDFHSIRHSVSTFLLSKNYSIEDIKIITGHSSTAVQSYVHPGRKELVGMLSQI